MTPAQRLSDCRVACRYPPSSGQLSKFDKFVSGEVHLYIVEVVPDLGQVDQCNDHIGIGGGGQAVGIAAGDVNRPCLSSK